MKNLVFCIFMIAFSLSGMSQVRFSEVDPDQGVITIKNYGSSTVDITDYRLCALFQYTNGLSPLTIVNGSLNLEADSSVELSGFSLMQAGSDLGLYKASGGFGDTASMVDFLQWGSSGNGRESVANSKGIWTTGDFIDENGPYFYQGDGNTDGLSTWSNVQTSIRDQLVDPRHLVVAPNPFTTSTSLSFNLVDSYNTVFLSLVLTDVLGRVVRPETTLPWDGKMTINRGSLKPGIYMLNLYEKNKLLANKKLIITD